MSIFRHYVLAAGGTGGHMVPAHAIAQELMARGHRVALITDARGAKIPGLFEDVPTHVLPAGRLVGGPLGWARGLRAILDGRRMARRLYADFEPSAVVGFGGYPALPALLGAFAQGVPALVHEQNAVLGRVNRLAARKVSAIATAYPQVRRLKPKYEAKVHLVGNPVRESVLDLREEAFPVFSEDSVLRLLVTGGSQGATILSSVVPAGLGMLPISLRRRLQVTQQCRPEDIEQVRAAYAEMEIPADLATYIEDMPTKLGWAHLVIARAGASTISELTAAGRPAILVPLPSAMDNHQMYNAREMAKAGGARMIEESRFTAAELAKQMQKLSLEPGALQNAAARAKACGRPDAVRDMADLIDSFGPHPLTIDTVRETPERGVPGFAGAPA